MLSGSALIEKINEISLHERCCTKAVLLEWEQSRPLAKRKVLLNCHLTKATLLLVELFINSGADLKITCTDGLVCHTSIKSIVKSLGLFLASDVLLDEKYKFKFDIIVDCGAYLANILSPKFGFVELTHVESTQYSNSNCPVISVDSGIVKLVETSYGTGDGFVRAISQIYEDFGADYKEKHYLIFGYGKVGKGICHCLYNSGVSGKLITVIESNYFKLREAQTDGFSAFHIKDQEQINKLLESSINCAVTSTGIENCISKYFNPSSFVGTDFLANMGTYDEWGPSFEKGSVLYNKRPLNFMLDYPTKIKYLDPIFAVLAYATIQIINEEKTNCFVLKRPNINMENKVLDIWIKNNYKDLEVDQIWKLKQVTEGLTG